MMAADYRRTLAPCDEDRYAALARGEDGAGVERLDPPPAPRERQQDVVWVAPGSRRPGQARRSCARFFEEGARASAANVWSHHRASASCPAMP